MTTCASEGVSNQRRSIYQVGSTLGGMNGNKFPSNRQVLGRFFQLHQEEKQTIHDSVLAVSKEVITFCDKARILIRQKCRIIKKIQTMHSNWQKIKKNAAKNQKRMILAAH